MIETEKKSYLVHSYRSVVRKAPHFRARRKMPAYKRKPPSEGRTEPFQAGRRCPRHFTRTASCSNTCTRDAAKRRPGRANARRASRLGSLVLEQLEPRHDPVYR